MEKVKELLSSEWAKKTYRIIAYALVEILASQAFILLLKDKIADELVYGVVIVLTVQVATIIKKLLGDEHLVSRIL